MTALLGDLTKAIAHVTELTRQVAILNARLEANTVATDRLAEKIDRFSIRCPYAPRDEEDGMY